MSLFDGTYEDINSPAETTVSIRVESVLNSNVIVCKLILSPNAPYN